MRNVETVEERTCDLWKQWMNANRFGMNSQNTKMLEQDWTEVQHSIWQEADVVDQELLDERGCGKEWQDILDGECQRVANTVSRLFPVVSTGNEYFVRLFPRSNYVLIVPSKSRASQILNTSSIYIIRLTGLIEVSVGSFTDFSPPVNSATTQNVD